jgi:hypothetical protein
MSQAAEFWQSVQVLREYGTPLFAIIGPPAEVILDRHITQYGETVTSKDPDLFAERVECILACYPPDRTFVFAGMGSLGFTFAGSIDGFKHFLRQIPAEAAKQPIQRWIDAYLGIPFHMTGNLVAGCRLDFPVWAKLLDLTHRGTPPMTSRQVLIAANQLKLLRRPQ